MAGMSASPTAGGRPPPRRGDARRPPCPRPVAGSPARSVTRAMSGMISGVAGVDPVGVGDVPVGVPDLRPEVGVVQEALGDVPEGVAPGDDVVGGAVRDLPRVLVPGPVRRDGGRALLELAPRRARVGRRRRLGPGRPRAGRRAGASRPGPPPARGSGRVRPNRTGFPSLSLATSWTGPETVPKVRSALGRNLAGC